jgi:hypothetical protein
MSRPSHRVMRACAVALDGLPPLDGYEANIVLVNRQDSEAHILVGKSTPSAVADALTRLIDSPDQVGIVNSDGVKLEV